MSAHYDGSAKRLKVAFRAGLELRVAPETIPELSNASEADLSDIVISPLGYTLHSPLIDAAVRVSKLVDLATSDTPVRLSSDVKAGGSAWRLLAHVKSSALSGAYTHCQSVHPC